VIDLTAENIIPLLDVRKFLPVSIPSLRRWAASGKLETIRAGAKVMTSTQAVQRMLKPGPQEATTAPLPRARRQHRATRRFEDAQAHLKSVLGDY
jgi:hypothetical protein